MSLYLPAIMLLSDKELMSRFSGPNTHVGALRHRSMLDSIGAMPCCGNGAVALCVVERTVLHLVFRSFMPSLKACLHSWCNLSTPAFGGGPFVCHFAPGVY